MLGLKIYQLHIFVFSLISFTSCPPSFLSFQRKMLREKKTSLKTDLKMRLFSAAVKKDCARRNFISIRCDMYEIDFKLHFNPSICIRFRRLLSPSNRRHLQLLKLSSFAAVKFSNLFYFLVLYKFHFSSRS